MRRAPALVAATAAAALTIGPLAAMAGAATAPNGVGTASVSSNVLSVQLGSNGDLLTVRVLGDDGVSTIDPTKGTPVSSETFRPLSVSSKLVPSLGTTVPAVSTSSSGTEDKKSFSAPIPSTPAFGGDLNAVLSSVIDTTGARSGLQGGLANLKLAGGLVSVPSGAVQVLSSATKTSASGNRSVSVPDVRVLDLSALLDGLGLKLTDLSVNQLLGLVKSLGVTVQGVADPAGAVTALNGAINTLTTTTGSLTAQVCNTVDGLLSGAGLGGVASTLGSVTGGTLPTGTLPTLTSPLSGTLPTLPVGGGTVPGILSLHTSALPGGFSCSNLGNATVADLLGLVNQDLGNLLNSLLNQLASTPLLEVTNVKVGLVATAADTVQHSVADVTASIGQVKVGNLAVPGISGLDLTAPVNVINQATSSIQGAVNNVLSAINAQLANLVKVDVLQITKGVTSADGYTKATSSITALKATITPPATPLTAQALDLSGTPVSSVLTQVQATVPTLSPVMDQLKATLNGLSALTGQSVVSVGTLSADAAFRPVTTPAATPAATPTGGELPRTGGDAALPAMLAVTVAGFAFGIRRLLRSATAPQS